MLTFKNEINIIHSSNFSNSELYYLGKCPNKKNDIADHKDQINATN